MADTYRVVRAIDVSAPPHVVFDELRDFHRWQDWSPWEGMDPDQKRTFSGADADAGAKYAWKGNRKVGEGSMEILEARSPSLVRVDVRFLKPFKSASESRFDITSVDGGSHVTWTMEGPQTVMTRVMGVIKSMDALVGPDFEKGLAQLKAVAEAKAQSA